MIQEPMFHAVASHSAKDANGTWVTRDVRRFSAVSVAEAKAIAEQDAKTLVERILEGREEESRYPYATRRLHEPILDTMVDTDGSELASITINSCGCEVLNAQSVLFIDVDLPERVFPRIKRKPASQPKRVGWLGRLLGRAEEPEPEPEPQREQEIHPSQSPAFYPEEEVALTKLRRLAEAGDQIAFRAYRTAGGLRYLCTSRLFNPATDDLPNLLLPLGADPRYVQLCQVQKTFRARLTPKPWRCGYHSVSRDLDGERVLPGPRYDRWKSRYQERSSGFAVCRLLREVGSGRMHPVAARILKLHDQATGVERQAPLA